MASVTFHGACGVVTGSCTRLTWGDHSILVDCGLYQGDEELARKALSEAISEMGGEMGGGETAAGTAWPRPALPKTGETVPW